MPELRDVYTCIGSKRTFCENVESAYARRFYFLSIIVYQALLIKGKVNR